ncbi:hypothetical protein SEA_EMOTION_59 [Arthrobacter phage Emotion]|uniref:Uncharacterized protein n=1 Tax=Arthrobacter phage Emotion TaxID=3038361 RepID=A0AA49ERJ6_9CAUD|nr:hypothetical protein SEA_EMOTION_59 [Arthrobacter phage Emotion]
MKANESYKLIDKDGDTLEIKPAQRDAGEPRGAFVVSAPYGTYVKRDEVMAAATALLRAAGYTGWTLTERATDEEPETGTDEPQPRYLVLDAPGQGITLLSPRQGLLIKTYPGRQDADEVARGDLYELIEVAARLNGEPVPERGAK